MPQVGGQFDSQSKWKTSQDTQVNQGGMEGQRDRWRKDTGHTEKANVTEYYANTFENQNPPEGGGSAAPALENLNQEDDEFLGYLMQEQ